ncbi:proliferating cell nuclear antigen-like [Populus alba x Populus x berolinensis]|uniref:Proliferating cell nuclear antigen-like n=1 Tax=Populus alba x Populus x berolinensis TaxID=444605 RepID=A0AAD6MKD9_9ROSI|nr:proliferating cell nuclear antigen-like [Populus alba x Populus x berolinensis]
MLKPTLVQGSLLKKVQESIKDLVNDGDLDCSSIRLSLQAVDFSHAALVSLLLLQSDGIQQY